MPQEAPMEHSNYSQQPPQVRFLNCCCVLVGHPSVRHPDTRYLLALLPVLHSHTIVMHCDNHSVHLLRRRP